MSCSEIINVCVSVVSIFIALLALFQTKRQITLSNKQQLFDRRLARYLEFNTIYALYTTNKNHLEKADTFCRTNNLIFVWLTNCSDLEEMMLAVSNEQHIALLKNEEFKKATSTRTTDLENIRTRIALAERFIFGVDTNEG